MAVTIDDCIQYVTLDDAGSVTNVEKGQNGTITGAVTFLPAWANNGAFSNANGVYIRFGNGQWFNPNKYAIGFWAKTLWSITNGIPNPIDNNAPFHWFHDINNFTKWLINLTNGFYASSRINGTFYDDFPNLANITWSANTNVRFLYVQDRDGIDGGPITRKFFINGVEVFSSTRVIPNQANAGTQFEILNQTAAGSIPWDGLMDELKIFKHRGSYFTTPYISEILANQLVVGFPAPGGFRLINGAIKTPIINGGLIH
jgi:hypothetical protein